MEYGVANKKGMVLYDDASAILELAWKNGIETIDTATTYGNSEKVLGNIGVERWSIITKLPVAPAGIVEIKSWIQDQIKSSLGNLGVTSLYAVMLHTTAPLSTSKADIYWNTLQELREQGVIQKIGYSIYEPTELDNFYEKFQPDIIDVQGVEFFIGNLVIDNKNKTKIVFTLQGLVSQIWRKFFNDIDVYKVIRFNTFRGLFLNDSLVKRQMKYKIRGENAFSKATKGIHNLSAVGFSPILTITRNWEEAKDAEMEERFLSFLKSLNIYQPRIKILPEFLLGRLSENKRIYSKNEQVTKKCFEDYDITNLQCSTSRMATQTGVYVCPILVDKDQARMGDTIKETLRPFPLSHAACYTCRITGMTCKS